ncbi:hypothetical protein JOF56_009919 [Kibdelosporangium banguiense]|uniref:Amino acid transporter n=1 Tax=Kibdelosporangium banguiense TaxID=1365924 RepID=A0ABS4TYQ8_9PSEU|nr:hypothetical protein [Kibdelosporangium banguiense]
MRPVVLVYTAISILITIMFGADVNSQAGAYATGILAMMVSGSIAVTISAIRHRQKPAAIGFMVLTLVLSYAFVENIIEKPDGIAISMAFIAGVVVISLVSRVSRTTELRADRIEFDDDARRFITDTLAHDGQVNIIANKRQTGDSGEYLAKELEQRGMNPVPSDADVLFLEIDVTDPSEFSGVLKVHGHEVAGHRILRAQSPAVPNAIAAVLLALRDATGVRPDLACRTRPVWQYRTVPALSALLSARSGDSRTPLRSAPTGPLRQPDEEVLHLLRSSAPHGAPAPRGARSLTSTRTDSASRRKPLVDSPNLGTDPLSVPSKGSGSGEGRHCIDQVGHSW